MSRTLPFALSVAMLTLLASGSRAGAAGPKIEAQLLPVTTAVVPGQPFDVCVRLTIEQGWHVYWLNPGTAGLPTKVAWQLPAGYTGGEIQYPVPDRFDLPGDIVSYGYEREVVLISTITAPKDAQIGSVLPLKATVSWLACAAVCVPGKATVETSLPVAAGASPANGPLYTEWKRRVPTAEPDPAADFGQRGISTAPGADPQSEITATIHLDLARTPPAPVLAFPYPNASLAMKVGQAEVVQVNRGGAPGAADRIRIPLNIRRRAGTELPAEPLPVVISYVNREGERRGFTMSLDLSRPLGVTTAPAADLTVPQLGPR